MKLSILDLSPLNASLGSLESASRRIITLRNDPLIERNLLISNLTLPSAS